MNIKEIDCGSWGWYFNDDKKLLSDRRKFLKSFILISLKYGINLSAFGIENGLNSPGNIDNIVEEIFKIVGDFEGNQLQKATNYNFYSTELSTRIMPSIIYTEEGTTLRESVCDDLFSVLFFTLKKGKLHSLFYNLRSNIFTQADKTDMLFYTNTTRFNSYIRCLHQLLLKFDISLFDCTIMEINSSFGVCKEGYLLYKEECLFYEDVYDLLPVELRYTPMEMISISFDKEM